MTEEFPRSNSDAAVRLDQSDAWLLLAVIYANEGRLADRKQITEAGDYINRAVFTDAEFEGGIKRLKARGCVIEVAGLYAPSASVTAWCQKDRPRQGPAYKDLEAAERFLGLTTR